MPNVTETQIAEFAASYTELRREYWAANLVHTFAADPLGTDSYALAYDMGQRYARVHQPNGSARHRSVVLFVDLANGDILKAAGWKGPAKVARGNIANGTADLDPVTGPRYLR